MYYIDNITGNTIHVHKVVDGSRAWDCYVPGIVIESAIISGDNLVVRGTKGENRLFSCERRQLLRY
jgi:hypothetical protein